MGGYLRLLCVRNAPRTLQRLAVYAALLTLLCFLVSFIPKPPWLCQNGRRTNSLTVDRLRDVLVKESDKEDVEPDYIDHKDTDILSMFPLYSKRKSQTRASVPSDKAANSSSTISRSNQVSDSIEESLVSPIKVFKLRNLNFSNFGRAWLNEVPNFRKSGKPALDQHRHETSQDPFPQFSLKQLRQTQKIPECVDLKVPYGASRTKICVHFPHEDNFISNRLRDTGTWEIEFLSEMEEFFLAFPKSQLVDLGCNIGVFSLFAASVGKPALAVDILPSNLALIQLSIATNDEAVAVDKHDDEDVEGILQMMGYDRSHRPKYADLITTLHNAIYGKHTTMYVYLKEDLNLGGTEVKEFSSTSNNGTQIRVDAICLDDLIPYVRPGHSVFLKMDIEGAEPDALQCANNFFMYVDVRVILVEILFHRYSEQGKEMARFLLRHNMMPSEDVNGRKLLDADLSKMYSWPENMFWIKFR